MLPLAFGLAKRVEPELGAANLGRLLVFANTMASFVLFVELFSLYIIFRNPIYLYDALCRSHFVDCDLVTNTLLYVSLALGTRVSRALQAASRRCSSRT